MIYFSLYFVKISLKRLINSSVNCAFSFDFVSSKEKSSILRKSCSINLLCLLIVLSPTASALIYFDEWTCVEHLHHQEHTVWVNDETHFLDVINFGPAHAEMTFKEFSNAQESKPILIKPTLQLLSHQEIEKLNQTKKQLSYLHYKTKFSHSLRNKKQFEKKFLSENYFNLQSIRIPPAIRQVIIKAPMGVTSAVTQTLNKKANQTGSELGQHIYGFCYKKY